MTNQVNRIKTAPLVGCLAALVTLTPMTDVRAQTGRVEGTVVNLQTGEPVGEARVIIEGTQGFALTDRHGGYSILDVPIGVYKIRVEAVGFEPTVYLDHRVMEDDGQMLEVQPTRVDIELRPLRWPPESQSVRTPPATAVQPGFGLGVSLGIEGLGGSANRSVQPGGSADLFVRYGMSFGLTVQAGGRFGTHGIDSVPSSIKTFGLYIEPRFNLLNVSSRWAPFVAGRFALTREAADWDRIAFEASGYSLGGGAGAIYRLTSQLALEGGLSVGLLEMGDYVFKGDFVSYQCMEGLGPGTPLPESVIQCGGLVSGLPVYNCYPPFHDRLSGDCAPPGITRVNSRRSGPWYRLWFGIHLSLGSSRGP